MQAFILFYGSIYVLNNSCKDRHEQQGLNSCKSNVTNAKNIIKMR